MTIDWDTLEHVLPGAPDVVALADGLDRDVPVVLLPVRVETRFDAAEVPDDGTAGKVLADALTGLHTSLRRLVNRDYATTLPGRVKIKKNFKNNVEQPLYAAVEADLATAATQLTAIAQAAAAPIIAGGEPLATSLTKLASAVEADLGDGHVALQALRSPYQRERLTALVTGFAERATPVLDLVRSRVIPAIRFGAQFAIRPAAEVARTLGRAPDGRLLRAELGAQPPQRLAPVVLDDGTAPHAVGATRIMHIGNAQLVDTAAAVETIRNGLAAGDAELERAAGALTVLPPTVKAELLDSAAKVPGAEQIRNLIAVVPSGDAALDATVPDRLRRVAFAVSPSTHIEYRLLVRVYPEPLAFDTHEPELTETEEAAALAYWTEVRAAGPDDDRALGAWRALCSGRTTRRAAWLAHATEPPDVAAPPDGALAAADLAAEVAVLVKRLDELGRAPQASRAGPIDAVERALAELDDSVAGAPPLPDAQRSDLGARLSALRGVLTALAADGVKDAVNWDGRVAGLREHLANLPAEEVTAPTLRTTKRRASTWTRAARSGVLPDRFAVVTVSGGRVTNVAQGAPVPANLALGFDPSAPEGRFSLDNDGNLVVDPAMRWLVDYDEAVNQGMAITVAITPDEARAGFDEVFVVGLAGGDAIAGADRLAAMIDAHHYTASGLSLLPVGTPTNNTEAQAAGHTSADDPDAAYAIERADPLTAPGSDGTALAAALGIGAAHLAHIAHADGRDAADSRTATAALYAATIGHALDELTAGLISFDARERLHTFVTGAVSPRGRLPGIRVADEPYGMLPVTALTRFVPSKADTAGIDGADHARQNLFDLVLLGVLLQMHKDWSRLRAAVKHAHDTSVGKAGYDAQQHFLAMLGLQATSVAASYRLGVNVADRGGVRHHPELSLSFGIPKDGDDPGAAQFGPFGLMERFTAPLQLAFGIGDAGLRASVGRGAGIADHWNSVWERLTGARAYELRYVQGTKPLRGTVAGPGIGNLLTADLRGLATGSASGAEVPLAVLLARHALLAEARRAAVRILFAEGLIDEAALARTSSSSMFDPTTISTSQPLSSWGVLFGSLPDLRARFGLSATGLFAGYLGGSPLCDYLTGRGTSALFTGSPRKLAHQSVIDALSEHATALGQLAALPPQRIEALVREHIDLGSHRLDAWLTGLAQRRLDTMRADRPTGVRIGAYGWVENLKPDPDPGSPAALPSSLAGRPGRPVIIDLANQGFVQTPLPAHAVTTAILRSGYASQSGEGTTGNAMSINLSSGRVRTALALIDGVRAGNDLGALLGYRLERFLHEYYARPDTPHVELDQTIAPLRRGYPTVAAVDPGADACPERERHVVDGLAVVRTVLDWTASNRPNATGTLYATLADRTGYPWGLAAAAVPLPTEVDKVDGLLRALDDVANAVDSLADLTTAEAVHQIVRGNHPRAAAVLQALAEGTAPPPAEIAQSPQSGLPVTHRVLLQLDPDAASWPGVSVTPRAAVEPAVDAWLGWLLGDPASIRVRVRPRSGSAAGAVAAPIAETSVADLGLRPLDLLAMLGPGFEAGLSELVAHVLDFRRPVNIEPDQPGLPTPAPTDEWEIDPTRLPAWTPGIRSIADVSPLLEAVHDLIVKARPATALDYTAQGGIAPGAPDSAEATARAAVLRDSATDTATALARLLAADDTLDAGVLAGDPRAFVLANDGVHIDPATREFRNPDLFWSARETWRSAIVAAARFGIRCAPPRRYASRSQVSSELLQAAEAAFIELTTRLKATTDALVPAVKTLLGESAIAVPRLDLDLSGDVASSLAARLATSAELDGWLEGAAAVRDGPRHLSEVLLLGGTDVPAQVAQLPFAAGELWLGGAVADLSAQTGRVCVVAYGALPAFRLARRRARRGPVDRGRPVPGPDHRSRGALRPARRDRAAVRAARRPARPQPRVAAQRSRRDSARHPRDRPQPLRGTGAPRRRPLRADPPAARR